MQVEIPEKLRRTLLSLLTNSDSKLKDSSTLFNMFMPFVYLNDNNYVFPRLESKYKFYDCVYEIRK